MDRKLKLSNKNKVVAGVCGGLGEYFNIDPTIVRLIFVLSSFSLYFTPILIYIICWFIFPNSNNIDNDNVKNNLNQKNKFSEFNDFSEFDEDNKL